MTNRIIQLSGSDTAIYYDVTYTAKGNRHDPVRPLIRRLIAERLIEADDIVEIYRGDMMSFTPCRAIKWAAWDTVDDPRDGLVSRPAYIGPHVRAANAASNATPKREGGFRHERRVTGADSGAAG